LAALVKHYSNDAASLSKFMQLLQVFSVILLQNLFYFTCADIGILEFIKVIFELCSVLLEMFMSVKLMSSPSSEYC